MSSLQLFGRSWRVTVGTLQLTTVDLEFQVRRTLKPEPATCNLKIYNLTPEHRKNMEQNPALQTLQVVPVIIEAGYGDSLAKIYSGQLRAGWTTTEGAESITELDTGDGEKQFATARMNVAFGPGTPVDTVLREIASVLGVSPGNIDRAVALIQSKGFIQFSVKGQVLKGNAADHMTDITKAAGLEWSIQDGAVQVLQLGQPLQGQALSLSASTGLVGAPAVDSKGLLNFTTLMIPGIKPGVLVKLDSANVKGGYRCNVCDYSGDTLGNDWYIKVQAEKF